MSAKESDLKVLNVKKGGLSGRCQRVSVASENEGSENVVPSKQVSSTELLQLVDCPAETTKLKKPNLSKYIDDNIRNFDLLKKRKDRSSTSGDSTTHSNASANSSFEKEAINSTAAAANNEEKQPTQRSPVKRTAKAEDATKIAVDTPSKLKSRPAKFSIDAVESPKASAAAVPALASVLARSSSILARSKKPPPLSSAELLASIEATKNQVAVQPVAVVESKASTESQGSSHWIDSAAPAAQPDMPTAADLTSGSCNNTTTNTNAPTVAFKKSTSVSVARDANSTIVEPAPAPEQAAVAPNRKVSFNAPAAPAVASTGIAADAPESALVCPGSQSKSSRRSVTGSVSSISSVSSASASRATATPSRIPSTPGAAGGPAAVATLTAAPSSAGILSDPSRTVELNGKHYIRLNVLGKGGSSCVYRIIGAEDGQVYAYKRVEVKDTEDIDSVFDNYANEIALLRRLSAHSTQLGAEGVEDGAVVAGVTGAQSRIIELVDFEVRRDQRYIAMILEAGDIDLAKVLQQKNTARSASTVSEGPQHILDPFFARMVWREMLEAVDHIHQHRIVHGDLKPANFVFVKGHLKLIDFGIAKSFTSDTTNIYRESQIGTINYMAPEAIAPMSDDDGHATSDRLKMRLGRASDIWSLGCILYQMVYGRPPFAALNTIQKLSTIPNPRHVIKYADWGDADAVDSMQACLKHDARLRSKIRGPEGLLERAYLQVPCNMQRGGANSVSGASSGTSQHAAIGKEQVQCIVGAVLDSLSNVAQQAVAKAQASGKGRVATRNTRSGGRNNADAEAAEKFALGVVKWIDEVNQDEVEVEVMEVVQEQEWAVAPVQIVTAPAVTVPPPAVASVPIPAAIPVPVRPVSRVAPVVAAKEAAPTPSKKASKAPASPSPSLKRKADDAPGSVTRSASKRPALSSTFSSAVKPASEEHREVTNSVPFSAKKTTVSTVAPSPRTLTARPAFLSNILGAPKLNAFLLKSTAQTVGAVPSSSGTSSSSTANNKAAAPLKVLPISLQQEIQNSAARRSSLSADAAASGEPMKVVDRAARWMKKAPEELDMRSELEKRIGAMRKFMNPEEDNDAATETMDMTGFNFF